MDRQLKFDLPEKLGFLLHPKRYKVAYGGRGGTKSWGFARALLILGWQKKKRILCGREIQRTIAESVHQLLKDQIELMELGYFYGVTDTEIVGQNGTQFLFAGLRGLDIQKMKSFEGVDICWLEEANALSKESIDVVAPTIRKAGSEIWASFNPELDSDEAYDRFVANPPIQSTVIKIGWQDNPWLTKELRDEKDDLQRRDPVAYDNIWEGNCRPAIAGAIYADEVRRAIEERRVRELPYDPLLAVHCFWDLGWKDAMTVTMVQKVASSFSIIDYMEHKHTTYAEMVNGREEVPGKEAVLGLTQRGYKVMKDYLPHDGKAVNPQTGKSAKETLELLKRTVEIVPDIGVEEGIRAARQLFSQCYFNELKTKRLFHCLKRYRRRILQSTKQAAEPLHDEFSHGADSLRYMAVMADGLTNDDESKFDALQGWR